MYTIDRSLKEFIESGVAVIVATGSTGGRPEVRYGWAARVHDDGSTVDVFLDTPRAAATLQNLRDNGRIAMTVAHPVNYRSAQFKGTFREANEPTAEDLAWVERGREAFLVSTSLVGDPPGAIRNLWMDDVVRVTFVVEQAFDQTPGPEAGKPL
jgi:hypothetical protein